MTPVTAGTPPAAPRRGRIRSHPLLLDLGLTSAAQLSLFVSNLLLVSLFARFLSATGIAEYLLLRRVVAWLQAGVQLGLTTGIPRYVAYESAGEKGKRETYFAAGAGCLTAVALSLGVILSLWPQGFSKLLFGGTQMSYLILPLWLTISGLALHTAAYGYFRGCLWMKGANLLQICNLTVLPILVLLMLVRFRSVALIMNVTGAVTILTSALVSVPAITRAVKSRNFELIRPLKQLLHYGVARVPGDFASAALPAIGPMVAAQFMPLSQVSPLLLASSLVAAASISVTPLGTLLLSKVSLMVGQNRLEEIRVPLSHMVNGVLEISIFITLQLILFADVVLKLWVGSTFLNAVPIVRIVALSIPFVLFNVALRSVIDAISVKAANAHNVLISLATMLVLIGVSVLTVPRAFLLTALACSTVITLAFLACLTGATVRRLCQVKPVWKSLAESLLVNVLIFGGAAVVKELVGFGTRLGRFTVFEILICGVYAVVLVTRRPQWLRFTLQKSFLRQPITA
ncbi:MAG: lipopolysaccharide biosynthesis protein [Bryobacteraceae bacterium]|jgi:O-antigen/teichoic acid export membrane protein